MEMIENIIGIYKITEFKGKGYFGVVYKGINLNTNEEVAIKVLYKENLNFKELQNELNTMKTINCENSVKYFADNDFGDPYRYYIIMEYCDCNLLEYLKGKGHLLNDEIRIIFKQLNNAFHEMRKYNIIHRDLKVDNIMMKFEKDKSKYTVKLADFGKSRPVDYYMSCQGNYSIMAPEVYFNSHYDEKCDLWSVGIMLHHLYFGYLPDINYYKFDRYINKIFENIRNSQHMAPSLRDLLYRLLVYDPNQRISWDEYFKHPFFHEK